MDRFDEWEIENFGCWSSEMHGDVIQCKYLHSKDVWNELHPRGVGGKGEHLEVRIDKNRRPPDGEMTFIGSNGSVICTRRSSADAVGKWINFTGPKYEEVVAAIKENEPVFKDRLILRWKTRKGTKAERFSSVIEASSHFFHIKPEILNSYACSKEIFTTYCKMGKEAFQRISVEAIKTGSKPEDTKVKFTLDLSVESKFLLRTSIWLDNGATINQKYEDNCMLDKRKQQIFSAGIPYEELFEEGCLTIVCCKVISGRYEYFRCYSDYMIPPYIEITESSRFFIRNVSENEGAVNPKQESEDAVSALANDLMCLYQDQELSDVELRCETVSFPTHRVILSARSPVFKAMLTGDMREAASGHVDVEDLDPHTLGRFLSYLYSGATGEEALQWEEALKLYYACDKYQVPSLKKECTAVLLSSVALGNVCDILSLADRHQDKELRSVAHDFIVENYSEVLESESWEKLVTCDPVLVAKTLTSVGKHKCLKKEIRN